MALLTNCTSWICDCKMEMRLLHVHTPSTFRIACLLCLQCRLNHYIYCYRRHLQCSSVRIRHCVHIASQLSEDVAFRLECTPWVFRALGWPSAKIRHAITKMHFKMLSSASACFYSQLQTDTELYWGLEEHYLSLRIIVNFPHSGQSHPGKVLINIPLI